jgi:hypothetical protein
VKTEREQPVSEVTLEKYKTILQVVGRALSHPVTRWLLIAETQVRDRVTSREIHGGPGIEVGVSPSFPVKP